MTLVRSILSRVGSERLAGVGVGLSVVVAYWAWSTWGQFAMIVAGLCLLPVVALIVLHPILGAIAVAFLVTALPTLMMPRVPVVILLVTLFGMATRKILKGDLSWRVTPFFIWSSLLLIWLGVSAVWASSYDFIGFANRHYGFLIALVFVEAVRTPADLRAIGLAAALGMIVTGLVMAYGFYEFITSGALFRISSGAAAGLENARFYGLWNSPNALAYSMMAFVAVAVSLVTLGVRRGARTLLIVAAVIGLIVIILTLSRGAWVCSAVMLVLAVRYYRKRWLALSALVLLVVLASSLLPVDVLDRVETLAHGRRDASLDERGILLHGGIRMVEESFPFGWGAGATFRYSADYAPHRLRPVGTHNSYVDVLAEGGLIGGLLLVGMVVSLFAAMRRSPLRSSSGSNETPRGILLSGLVAVVIGMNFENVIGFPAYWLYFTLVSLYPLLSSQAAPAERNTAPSLVGREASAPDA